MASVQWIKLTTDMFDNRKIKHLRKLPEGNNIVLIWVMLLTMAGRCNANGMIFLTQDIPYTTKMLADEMDFEENTIVLALSVLEQLNMIITDNKYLTIAGWQEYQNIEGMDKIREQTKLRVAKYREKQKTIGNVTRNVTVTQSNATDKDIDKEEDKNNINKNNIDSRCETIENRSTPSTPPLFEIELKGKTESKDYHFKRVYNKSKDKIDTFYCVYDDDIKEYKEFYPSVDIEYELRKIVAWVRANPTRMKTPKGVKSFIHRWLSSEQDKYHEKTDKQEDRNKLVTDLGMEVWQ